MRVSVVQMSPGADKLANIAQAEELIADCVGSDQPDLVVLPEVWTCLGGTRDTKFTAAEILPEGDPLSGGGAATAFLSRTARRYGIHLHGGSIGEHAGDRLRNTSLLFGPDGHCLARYSKIHLFDIVTPTGEGYRESETYLPGDQVVTVDIAGDFGRLRLGLAICYDIRFGELFHRLRRDGAELVLLPAAFTAETGAAHWETLIRARAIETQCVFAAAGTTGTHVDAGGASRQTYGHSMIVDSWGTPVAQAASGPGWTTAHVDQAAIARIRTGIPVMEHRRLS